MRQLARPSRAFVTGGTGFVGSHLVRHLVDSGDHVAVLVRPESDFWRIADVADRIEPIVGRLSEPDGLRQSLAGFKPDVVYHLGWFGSGAGGREDPRQITENVSDSTNLVELAGSAGARIWIGLGSQAECGPTTSVLTESSPTRPVNPYGVAKLEAGLRTRELCEARSMRHVWLRLLTAYGPADHPTYLVPYVIVSLLRGDRPLLTEGRQPGDFLHAADASKAIRACAVAESCSGTYILSSGEHRQVRDVALAIRDAIDPSLTVGLGQLPSGDRPTGLRGDPSALKAVTGWAPQVSLETGIAGCVEWYRRNLDRYPRVS